MLKHHIEVLRACNLNRDDMVQGRQGIEGNLYAFLLKRSTVEGLAGNRTTVLFYGCPVLFFIQGVF